MVAEKRCKRLSRPKFYIPLLVAAGLIAWFMTYAFDNINAIVIRMAEARANQLAVQVINRAIVEAMESSVTYSDLISVVMNEEGGVSFLQANTLLMHKLAARAALIAQQDLGELAEQGIVVPLGSALGIDLFGGAGPRIPVSVVPVGAVTTRFTTAFHSAGINQTRHEISLEATVQMRIVVPSGANSVKVNIVVPVAESIIVGQVPQMFVDLPDAKGILNLVP